MAHGKVGFGKDEMLSYKQKHNSAVHTAENARSIGVFLENTGDGIVIGAATLAPFTGGASAPAIPIGEVAAGVGVVIQLVVDFTDGQKRKATKKIILEVISFGVGN